MSEPQETFLVDYPCDLHCQVEIDLTGMHGQFTLRQARVVAQHEHEKRHRPPRVVTPAHDRLAASFRSASGR